MGGGGRGGGGGYRRRRVLVVLVVAVTALVGVRLTGAGADAVAGPVTTTRVVAPPVSAAPSVAAVPSGSARPSTAAGPSATARPSGSAVPPPSASRSTSPSASASAAPSRSAAPSSTAGAAGCGSAQLRVGALAAVGDANSTLVAGSPVRFTLTVASTATVSCLVRPGLGMTVTSGKDRIWTTGDCPLSPIAEPGLAGPVPTTAPTLAGTAQGVFLPAAVTLAPGAVATLDIVWPGNRSVGSCTAGPATLRAGTYVADVTVDGVGSAHTAFQLS